MSARPSLAGRAALAVGLTIGFYVLALALIAVLVSLPILEVTELQRLDLRLALGCLLGAAAIGWAILPRIDRFVPPGPRLEREREPRLLALVDEVAAATGQAAPAEVYLLPDVNAFVMQRGGVMGVGSRRVMGIGLPLMGVLDKDQLRAVLAHEFGHFHGGDTKLGPWIHKTRTAIFRTLAGLKGHRLLRLPFQLYAKAFLRTTQAVSRQQELAADALAARIAGADAMGEGLRRVAQHAVGFDVYWKGHFTPMLGNGLRPPLLSGYERFLAVPEMSTQLWSVAHAMGQQANVFDSHPPLAARLSALGQPQKPPGLGPGCARELLGDVEAAEERLTRALLRPEFSVKAASWQDVAMQVVLPRCREAVSLNRAALAGLTPRGLPERLAKLGEWSQGLKLATGGGKLLDARTRGRDLLAAALIVGLAREGWRVVYVPGVGPRCELDGCSLEPFTQLPQLSEGKLTPAAWLELCETQRVPEFELGAAG